VVVRDVYSITEGNGVAAHVTDPQGAEILRGWCALRNTFGRWPQGCAL
jgi:hypothetical protein